MRLSRTDFVPVLAIVAGGVVGASLSFSFLGSGDVPAPDPVVVPVAQPVVVPSAPAEEPASSGQANSFDLQQNYPNPFNPETTIPFILHEGLFTAGLPAQVSMRIFNALTEPVAFPVALGHSSGEGVALIELEYTQPGTYEAFWDGTDQSGREVASGVYFVQLMVNGRLELSRLFRAIGPAREPVSATYEAVTQDARSQALFRARQLVSGIADDGYYTVRSFLEEDLEREPIR